MDIRASLTYQLEGLEELKIVSASKNAGPTCRRHSFAPLLVAVDASWRVRLFALTRTHLDDPH